MPERAPGGTGPGMDPATVSRFVFRPDMSHSAGSVHIDSVPVVLWSPTMTLMLFGQLK